MSKLRDVPRGEVLALIERRWTNARIAAHYGCSADAVTKYRKSHKIVPARAEVIVNPADIAALAVAGYFDQEIAIRLGYSRGTVKKLRKMHGIELSRVARQSRVEAEKRRDREALPKAPSKIAAHEAKIAAREAKIATLYGGRTHEDVSAAVLAREFAVRTVRTVRNVAELHDPQFRGEFP